MRKKVFYLNIIITFFILLSSCEKIIEMNIDDIKPIMSVNSIISTNNSIRVNIAKTIHILDKDQIPKIKDANVKLYEDDIYIGNLNYVDSSGSYILEYYPKFGKEYKVEAFHKDFGTAYGSSKFVNTVKINNLDTVSKLNNNGRKDIKLSINFTDPPSERNYYILALWKTYHQKSFNPDIITYDTIKLSVDSSVVITNQGGYEYREIKEDLWIYESTIEFDMIVEGYEFGSGGIIFSDQIFDGRDYAINLVLPEDNFYYGDTTNINVILSSISEEYYKYLVSLSNYNYSKNDPLAEPVSVFSNITNGIGIVGTISRDSKSFDVVR